MIVTRNHENAASSLGRRCRDGKTPRLLAGEGDEDRHVPQQSGAGVWAEFDVRENLAHQGGLALQGGADAGAGQGSALVERVRKAQIAELIDANELLLPPVKEQIKWELGIGRETQNWRGAVARFQAECDEITVIIISVIEDETESGAVTIFIPPNNACAPLLESTLEIVYGDYVTGAEEIKRCEKYTCVNVSPYLEEEIVGCAKTIYLVDTTFSCPDEAACPEVENCEEIEEGYIIDVLIPH